MFFFRRIKLPIVNYTASDWSDAISLAISRSDWNADTGIRTTKQIAAELPLVIQAKKAAKILVKAKTPIAVRVSPEDFTIQILDFSRITYQCKDAKVKT